MIITIDGPAGAGKSTVAKLLAAQLHIAYLDTGAMYRAVTLKGRRASLKEKDEEAWVDLAKKTTVALQDANGKLKVFLDDEDVSEEIRSDEVTEQVRYVAQIPGVRDVMVKCQRNFSRGRDMVGEGRDLGTVVFPEADFKFYLDADAHERLQRRARELKAKGEKVDDGKLQENMKHRDTMDQTRPASPLKPAPDSSVIDSTRLSAAEVVAKMIQVIQHG